VAALRLVAAEHWLGILVWLRHHEIPKDHWHVLVDADVLAGEKSYLALHHAIIFDLEPGRAKVRNILLHELNHRVKNTLATVQAIAIQTMQNAQTLEAFQEAFEARLIALSKTHDLLIKGSWEGALLRDLVLQELLPYRVDKPRRFAIDGQDVQLQPRMVLALSLAFHELATNAVKYGALSVATGRIDVAWEVSEEGGQRRLRVHWVESGGPPVAKPSRRGLGSRLIERNLAHELNGEARLDFDASGVRCTIDVPLPPSEETSADPTKQ
jgi:two-component sensor histidine kinase